MTAKDRYGIWLEKFPLNEEERRELEAIKDDEKKIEDAFWQELQFGTAGLRGIMGPGSNRMNRFTVARAATGFAEYILEGGEENKQKGVVISYDSRNRSREFAELTAAILVKSGINVHFASELHPVPMTSYAIRKLNAAGGVMITASHNPRIYNGFKAFGADGAQFAPEAAASVASHMKADYADILDDVPSFNEASASILWHWVGDEWDRSYLSMLEKISLNKEAVAKCKDLKIVYTPLYGSGKKPIERILQRIGFENVMLVEEQACPDGNFPTAPYPNPEMPEVLELGIEKFKQEDADVLIATDPDSDRLGVVVRDSQGEMKILLGNQIGILLTWYLLSSLKEQGKMPAKPYVVTTVVSSRLTRAICEDYGAKLYECLTGFKFVAEQIHIHSDIGDEDFIFGFEESFGYLAGNDVRDKDAVVAAMLICELCAVAKTRGKTLYDMLLEVYDKYGYAAEKNIAFTREGKEGGDKIKAAMQSLRENSKEVFDDLEISALTDIEAGKRYDFENGGEEEVDFSKSNVLVFDLKDDAGWFAVRPSGTEPKIKIYCGVHDSDAEKAQAGLQKLCEGISEKVEKLL